MSVRNGATLIFSKIHSTFADNYWLYQYLIVLSIEIDYMFIMQEVFHGFAFKYDFRFVEI